MENPKNESNRLKILETEHSNVKFTDSINVYLNKSGHKCVNEFEICQTISRGLIWRVKKVLRYYNDEMGNLQKSLFAMKKTHINTQKKHRFYIDFQNNKTLNYFDKISIKIIDEIEILSTLNLHENIVTLYEVIYNQSHQYIYLITEYCDLGTVMNKHQVSYNYQHNTLLIDYFLKNIFNEKYNNFLITTDSSNHNLIELRSLSYEIKNDIAKFIFRQVLTGLKYIHGLNICHKDIKPENLVFSSINNKCKLIDFSISKMFKKDEDVMINEPGGSIHFQAPELFAGLDSYYDPYKYDIWSLGISLYIFLAEEFPFDSDSELQLQMMISEKEIIYPKDFGEDVILLLSMILNKNPEKRLTDIDLILNNSYFKQ